MKFTVRANEELKTAVYVDGKLSHIKVYWPCFYGGETVRYEPKNESWIWMPEEAWHPPLWGKGMTEVAISAVGESIDIPLTI